MFCKKCGVHLNDDAIKCPVCGQPVPGYEGASTDYENVKDMDSSNSSNNKGGDEVYTIEPEERIETHLFGAIVVTMMCCVPSGIFALYHAGKVATLIAAGCLKEAAAHSKSAYKWIIVSVVLWCVLMLCVIACLGLMILCILTIGKGIR